MPAEPAPAAPVAVMESQCPTCGAPPGAACRSVINRAPVRKPHKTRAKAGQQWRPPASRALFKERVLHRCGYRCEFVDDDGERCPQRATQAHHILPLSQGGPDDPENGLGLCAPHHRFVHNHPAWSYMRGMLRRSTAVTVIPPPTRRAR